MECARLGAHHRFEVTPSRRFAPTASRNPAETYIIGRDGRVVEKIVGRKNWTDEKFIKSVQALL